MFHAFVIPLTPARLARASAGLIDESAIWSALAALPWPVPTQGTTLAISLLVVAALGFVAYALAVALVWGQRATVRGLLTVALPAAAFLGISALALPTQSSDIVDYLLSGRVAAVHGESPYDVAPDAFPEDPLLPYASGTYTKDTEEKPPVWIGAAVLAAMLTVDMTPADAVLAGRLLFLGLTVINAALIFAVLRRWKPDHVLAGLVLYTWSPIVILHGQAKFDTLMATFALLAALALVCGRPLSTIAALWLSVMVKLLTLPLVAVTVLGEVAARRWRRFAASGAVVAAMTVALYVPFDDGTRHAVDHFGLAAGAGGSLPRAAGLAFGTIAGVMVLWAGLRSRTGLDGTMQGWALASLAVILVTPVTWSWYFIMPTAVISLSGDRWKSAALVVGSALVFVIDTWGRSNTRAHPLPTPFDLSRSDVALLGVALIAFAAVMALATASVIGRLRRGPSALPTSDESKPVEVG
jgi:hypothetical protein